MKPAMNHPLLIRFSAGSIAILCPTHHRNGRHSETNLECRTLRSGPQQENRRGLSRYAFRPSTHGGTARHPRLALPRSESNLSAEEPVAARKAACAFARICLAPPPPPPLPLPAVRGDGCRKEDSAGTRSSIGRQYPVADHGGSDTDARNQGTRNPH